MKILQRPVIYLLGSIWMALAFTSCTPNPSQPQSTDNPDTLSSVEGLNDPVMPLSATRETFEDFLKYFRTSETYKHWPDSVQLRFMDDIDFYRHVGIQPP